jgi:hypothetical protein
MSELYQSLAHSKWDCKYPAAKLAAVLADERSARETCPVVPVAIPGGGAGDLSVESPGVKVLVGKVEKEKKTESAPTGGQTNRQVAARANCSQTPKSVPPTGIGGWEIWEVPRSLVLGRRPASSAKELGGCSR